MTLRERVEAVFPGWRRWYPSLFDAANDLGLIRAEVCSPDSLLLSKRHAKVRRAAEDAHRERWGGGPAEDPPDPARWNGAQSDDLEDR
jgi:hypothetical protein